MLLLIVLGAAAAPPGTLVLPPGEDPGDWRGAARLAGLTLGPCAASPCVLVERTGGGWTLRAGTRELAVPVPGSESSREEIAALAAGLLRDLTRPDPRPALATAPAKSRPTGPVTFTPKLAAGAPPRGAPVPPTRSNRPTAPSPSASPREAPPPQPAPNPAPPVAAPRPPPPATAAVPPDPAPSPPLSAETSAPPTPTEPPAAAAAPASPSERSAAAADPPPATGHVRTTRPTAWIAAHSAWSVRGGADSGPVFAISGGLRVANVDLGLRGGGSPARLLDATEGAGSMAAAELTVVATWAPPGPVAPLVGVEAGTSWRWFATDQPVDDFAVPFAGCELGVALSAGVLTVAPHATARIDLSSTTVQRGDAAPRPLAPWDVGGGLSVRLHFP